MKRCSFVLASALFIIMVLSSSAVLGQTIQLPQTGQINCYDVSGVIVPCEGTGQDGEFRAGVLWPNPRFMVVGECVTDNLTGLTFTRNAYLAGYDMSWQQALNYISALNSNGGLCGYTDWRLPNRNELSTIIDRTQIYPALPLDHPFTNVNPSYYWSSSTDHYSPTSKWIVDLWYGFVTGYSQGYTASVWPIRGQTAGIAQVPQTGQTDSYAEYDDGYYQVGVSWPQSRFTDLGACIRDELTGLTWPRSANLTGSATTWQQALDSVASLNSGGGLCGYTDWRLPNATEMLSLYNMGAFLPAWAADIGFTNIPNYTNFYWTSTTLQGSYESAPFERAWISYLHGSLGSAKKGLACQTWCGYVWPIRGGYIAPPIVYRAVSLQKIGAGTVTSDPTGVSCGPDCTSTMASFPENTLLTLSAVPDVGSIFAYWTGGCNGTLATCTLTLAEDASAAATFVPSTTKRYPLSVSRKLSKGAQGTIVSQDGTITCTADISQCKALYYSGTPVTLTATPSEGSRFVKWTGACMGTFPTCAVIMNTKKSVTGVFAR